MKHERLPKVLALPVFASDALSSVAYATEEILLTLMLAGSLALSYSVPITTAIVILLTIVVMSYRQTVHAYPSGGGAYFVAKENLGVNFGLLASAALLVDYVLTVAVSTAAGTAAIISAFPTMESHRLTIALLCIALLTVVNLRGAKESGLLFAVPTYLFIASLGTLILVGLFKHLVLGVPPPDLSRSVTAVHPLTLWLMLRAFAGGCAAMTGTEAVSDGVAAFKPPESRNAATTLALMGLILGSLFFGITTLANLYHVVPLPDGRETVVSQIARGTFGTTWFYFLIQGTTAAILILASNTSYADFPRLSSILAKDGFLPRQLANLGDRLVFANGIVVLGLLSSLLIVIFKGSTHALIPLYAIGVFLSFTLSQAGMVVRQMKRKEPGWVLGSVRSAVGATATGIVAMVIASAKFIHGAWIVLVILPLIVMMFHAIKEHYLDLGKALRIDGYVPRPLPHHTVVVLVPNVHRGVMQALEYARSMASDVRALHVESDPSRTENFKKQWETWGEDVPLVILESQFRSVIGPVLDYLEEVKHDREGDRLTVVIPEFVPKKWWQHLMHNQMGLLLKISLMFRQDIVVTNVRYYVN